MYRLLPVLLVLSLVTACGPNVIYEKEYEIPGAEWSYADTLDFEVTIDDTLAIYNLFLDLEYSRSFPFENMYVQIHTRFPSGERYSEQVSLEMADEAGLPLGDCDSEGCELTIPLQTSAYFNQAGTYLFTLEQYSRRDPLPGVESLTLRVEETEERRGVD